MPFVVKANAETAKEAFAKAVKWHVAKRFRSLYQRRPQTLHDCRICMDNGIPRDCRHNRC